MSVEVKSCKKCKKLFKSADGSRLCPACVKKTDEQFVTVREYIYDNPHSSMDQVCEGTGADKTDIINWLRQGKLVLSDDSVPLINCETCGKPILTGRYCDDCSRDVQDSLRKSSQTLVSKTGGQKKDEDKGRRGTHLDI